MLNLHFISQLRRSEEAEGTPWKTANDGTLETRKPQKRPEDTSSDEEDDDDEEEEYGSKAVGNGRIANALRQSAAKAKAEARAAAAAREAAKPKLTRWQPPDVQGEETKEVAKEALNFWAYEAEVNGGCMCT